MIDPKELFNDFQMPDTTLIVLFALAVGVAWVFYAENKQIRQELEAWQVYQDGVINPTLLAKKPCNCQEHESEVTEEVVTDGE